MTRQVKMFSSGMVDVAGGRNKTLGRDLGLSAESFAFISRTSGLDSAHILAYEALIDGLVADGIWTKLDVLYVFATQDSTTALLNLISASFTATSVNSPAFAADLGFTGSAAKYLDSNFNPSTASSPKFVQNSAHVSAWSVTNLIDSNPIIGMDSAAGETDIFPRYSSDNNAYYRINSAGIGGVLVDQSVGHYVANRSTSSAVQGYKNGVSVLTNGSATSNAPLNASIQVLGVYHKDSNVHATSSHQCAAVTIGSSLNSTEAANLYNRLLTYMSSVGAIAVSQFLARTSGLDAAHVAAYTALIKGLIVDGIWSKLDVLYIYATQDSTTALLNLVQNVYNGVANGSPTFTADRGFTGTAGSTTKYINTGFAANLAIGAKYTNNSGHISAWSVTDIGSSSNAIMGIDYTSSEVDIYPDISGTAYFRVNSTAIAGQSGRTTSNGHYLANRSDSTHIQGYVDGSSIFTNNSVAASGLLNEPIYVLGVRNAAVASQTGGGFQVAMASIGASFSANEVAAFQGHLRTFMTTVGVP